MVQRERERTRACARTESGARKLATTGMSLGGGTDSNAAAGEAGSTSASGFGVGMARNVGLSFARSETGTLTGASGG